MFRVKLRNRKGYILFTAVIITAVLLLVFQTTFTNVRISMAQARDYEVLNQMKCTAKTAVMKSLQAKSSQSGTFPTASFHCSTTYTQNGIAVSTVATVTYTDGSTYKVQADGFLYNGKVKIYRWKRIT
jgi:hypothetical protein